MCAAKLHVNQYRLRWSLREGEGEVAPRLDALWVTDAAASQLMSAAKLHVIYYRLCWSLREGEVDAAPRLDALWVTDAAASQ